MLKSIEIFIDGASKGNPGPSGVGIVFLDANKNIIKKIYKFIGNATNNVAEYTALIYALQEALIDRYEEVVINSDSELLTRQLRGEYKVKNEELKVYFEFFNNLSRGFQHIDVRSILREDNSLADKLANKAVDSRFDNSLKIE